MTERIHPTHEAPYPHADRTAPLPSAPPLHGSMAAIQMPEKVIHKEQEEVLISRYEHAQTRQNDDHIYSAPPPVYQSYGAKAYTDESYSMAAAGGRPGCHRRRRSGCCCCLISFVVTLGTLILIAGVAALVVYLVVRPTRKPQYVIEGLEVREFNVTNGGESLLNSEMDLKVEARNGNKKIGIDYSDIEVKVFYEEEEIGEGSIPGFYQGHKNTTVLTIPIEGYNIRLTSAATSAFESDMSMWLGVNARAKARVKIGRWKSRRHTFHLLCSLHLSTSPHLGNLTLLSSTCKLKKPKVFFLV